MGTNTVPLKGTDDDHHIQRTAIMDSSSQRPKKVFDAGSIEGQ